MITTVDSIKNKNKIKIIKSLEMLNSEIMFKYLIWGQKKSNWVIKNLNLTKTKNLCELPCNQLRSCNNYTCFIYKYL